MYTPAAFTVAGKDWALELIQRYPFGLLISVGEDYPQSSHLPMLAIQRDDALYVVGHVARANPHAEAILAQARATAIFSGPHAFVSANWYEEPYATVPTWNYTAVHASGRLQRCDAKDALKLLTTRFEGRGPGAWRLEGLEEAYLEKQLRGIVAFELRLERLEAKAKLSQNRTDADRARVIAALSRSDDPVDRDCAQAMQNVS